MTAYQLYSRLNLHVRETDEAVTAALLTYADAHVKGGRGAIQPEHTAAILAEHHDAQDLYHVVMRGV